MNKIPVGYQALIKQFKLNPIPHYRTSMVVLHGSARTTLNAHNELHEYSKSYMPREPDNPFAQLEFALKYDGINLQILALVFKSIGKQHLCAWIQERFTSKYTRMVWFLFEFLLEEKLDLPDCKKIKYIDLLDPNKYFTARPIKSSRHGINNNLLGNKYFCPIVRRTPILEEYINKKFNEQANAIIQRYEPNIIARANNYLLVSPAVLI